MTDLEFPLTVAGARHIKDGHFLLAEGLAREIPARIRSRCHGRGYGAITKTLTEARDKITEEVGDTYSIRYLYQHLEAGLWFQDADNPEQFRWHIEASFWAHCRAAQYKVTPEEFASLKKRSGPKVIEYANSKPGKGKAEEVIEEELEEENDGYDRCEECDRILGLYECRRAIDGMESHHGRILCDTCRKDETRMARTRRKAPPDEALEWNDAFRVLQRGDSALMRFAGIIGRHERTAPRAEMVLSFIREIENDIALLKKWAEQEEEEDE